MRHLKTTKHLSRTKSHRKALTANLSAALFTKKRIVTTLAKAKYCRPRAERFITCAKKETLAARRHVLRYIPRKDVVKLLFDEIAPAYKERPGGYTRIIKLGHREGDAAPMAILELVGFEEIALKEKMKREQAKKDKKEEQDKKKLLPTKK
ncbi:50S ribosomal protein L17 [bacterium]|nr:50S ribosomal protein L17 [FCB group bacterium]MBL7191555.1 50S ribosomal protein L17 [bacterium]